MTWDEALTKLITKNPNYNNLDGLEKAALVLGFLDGWEMAQQETQEKLEAYRAYVAGKINLAALEEALR